MCPPRRHTHSNTAAQHCTAQHSTTSRHIHPGQCRPRVLPLPPSLAFGSSVTCLRCPTAPAKTGKEGGRLTERNKTKQGDLSVQKETRCLKSCCNELPSSPFVPFNLRYKCHISETHLYCEGLAGLAVDTTEDSREGALADLLTEIVLVREGADAQLRSLFSKPAAPSVDVAQPMVHRVTGGTGRGEQGG